MFETIRLSSYLSLRQPWSWMACTLVMFCCVLTHAGAADTVDKAEKKLKSLDTSPRWVNTQQNITNVQAIHDQGWRKLR